MTRRYRRLGPLLLVVGVALFAGLMFVLFLKALKAAAYLLAVLAGVAAGVVKVGVVRYRGRHAAG